MLQKKSEGKRGQFVNGRHFLIHATMAMDEKIHLLFIGGRKKLSVQNAYKSDVACN